MTLPAIVDDAKPASASPSLTVFVVEADAARAETIAAALGALGHRVLRSTPDRPGAGSICERERVDLVVTGVVTGVGGGDAAGGVSASELEDELRLPVVSIAMTQDLDDERVRDAAAEHGLVLGEPSADRLRRAVERASSRGRHLRDLADRAQRLEQRLEDRKSVERAKWLLVERQGVTEPEAMRRLQRTARNQRRTLRDVARSLLEMSETI